MCLAIFKPKGVEIKRKYLRNGFNGNEDGAGFAICRNGKVEIHKGFFTLREFEAAFQPFNNAREVAIIHFRMSTSGKVNKLNCHPFNLCGDEYAAIHNGIFDIERTDHARSDTAHFVELVLEPMLQNGLFGHPALQYLIETSIGKFNKLVILRGDGSHAIYNEDEGEWHNGAWYSNGGYKYSWRNFCLTFGYGDDHWSSKDWSRHSVSYPATKHGAAVKYLPAYEKMTEREAFAAEQQGESFPDYEPSDDSKAYQRELARLRGLTDEELEAEERGAIAEEMNAALQEGRVITQAEQDDLDNHSEYYAG